MLTTCQQTLRAIGMVLTIVLLGACATTEEDPGRRSLGTTIDDRGIDSNVSDKIQKAAPELEGANINVTSYNGIVLLTGQAPNEDMRQLAAQTAASVRNVRRVHNELEVGFKISFAARSNDTFITTKIKSKLLSEKNIKDSRVKVITENGTVYLMGLVSHAEGDIAAQVAQETGGVQKVVRIFEYIDE